MEYNVYCDESCHLEHSKDNVMVLGAVYCPKSKKREICDAIIHIKAKYDVDAHTEAKWVKVSPSKLSMYKELVDYFFNEDSLHFRAVVADKSNLDHLKYNQTHDEWYYKMYFIMLNYIFNPNSQYNVYLDIKDTRSSNKIKRLYDILVNSNYDWSHTIIKNMQPIRSEEVQIMQLTDILIGAISYINRNLFSSEAKLQIVDLIKAESGKSLVGSTYYSEKKFNIFVWGPDYYA
ncbi:MAG: DUF3800 domain-containing protein [Lactimicrobium massiliense]|nr:DUF3800 domain-containing protein [Lactimicrobium massiliense]MDD6230727.1 DUF3800 domain-containing protein [Lactimicrobium massiliense]MDD6726868.1 DUF3800 domain-containing protein [Lactimicrobium massiliense]